MLFTNPLYTTFALVLTLLVHKTGLSQTSSGSANISNNPGTGKELYLPAKVWQVPDNNNYNDTSSTYCYQRMVNTNNIALFWAKAFGPNPEQTPIH